MEEVQENESSSGQVVMTAITSSRAVVVKKEDRSDVKPIVSSKKKQKRQLDEMVKQPVKQPIYLCSLYLGIGELHIQIIIKLQFRESASN